MKITQWRYEPKSDITAYELALILPLLSNRFLRVDETERWLVVRRHFIAVQVEKPQWYDWIIGTDRVSYSDQNVVPSRES
jgi:hypothetical protein